MQGHMRTNHPTKQFKCTFCGKVSLIVLFSSVYKVISQKYKSRLDFSRYLLQEFERKDYLQTHVEEVHLKQNTVDCPTCGDTFSRYYTGNFLSNILSRVSSLPGHFQRFHLGCFRATARIKICSRCGKFDICNCTMEKEEMTRKKLERRVQEALGLNRPTRRY